MIHDNYLWLVESNKQQIEEIRSKTHTENSETRAVSKRVWIRPMHSAFVAFSRQEDKNEKNNNNISHFNLIDCFKVAVSYPGLRFLFCEAGYQDSVGSNSKQSIFKTAQSWFQMSYRKSAIFQLWLVTLHYCSNCLLSFFFWGGRIAVAVCY